MDTKTLIADAKARFSFNASKTYLHDKYTSKLIFADQNGLWRASIEFISALSALEDDTLVLLDDYKNPIKVNRSTLLAKAKNVYSKVMEDWYNEFEELKNTR